MTDKRPRMKRPAAISDLLAEIFKDKPAGKRLKEGKIWLAWERSVGKQIAARARPAAFRDGTLTVSVDNAPWMQQLTYLKKEIIARLNENIGDEMVMEIYLKAGSASVPDLQESVGLRKSRPLTLEERQKIKENAAIISDPELREVISELMGTHLKKT